MHEVPEYVTAQLKKQKEAEKASILSKMGQVTKFCTTPVRSVKMALYRDGRHQMEMVIIPAVDIYVKERTFFNDGQFLSREGILYYVADTKKAFPLAHVYKDSGHLCLGNIFVPSKVPLHSPQQPLETLFLHNDRVLSHGGASLQLEHDVKQQILAILLFNNIELSDSTLDEFKTLKELLAEDTIWKLSAEVYQQKDLLNALSIMTQIYNIIFAAA